MSAIKFITQRSRVKQPQFVSEGVTPATYGIIPTNPVLLALGRDTVLVDNSSPEAAELRQAGDVDREDKTFLTEGAGVTMRTKLTLADGDIQLLKTIFDKPQDPTFIVDTPDESLAFIDSYLDSAGTEIFRQFLGCKPISYSLSLTREGYYELEISYSSKTILESSATPVIGSGSFATSNTLTPLTHNDSGAAPFFYAGSAISIQNITFTGTFNQGEQDALGSPQMLYAIPTQRIITGSAAIYKTDETFQEEAKAVDSSNSAAFTINASPAIVINLSNFLWLVSAEELTGDDAAATLENKSFEAEKVSLFVT